VAAGDPVGDRHGRGEERPRREPANVVRKLPIV
jgi:hypothetical protein